MAGLPWSISIEPTTSCNLWCPECPSGLRKFTRPTGSMNLIVFNDFIKRLGSHLVYLILYFQGEPFLNKHFLEMVKLAKNQKIYVATSTNGHFLDSETAKKVVESGLDRLIISFDGMDQVTYEKYRRGGNLETVKHGIANIMFWKKQLSSKHPFVELQFLVMGTNEHQADQVKSFAKESGVEKLTMKSVQVYEYEEGSPYIPSLKKNSRYIKNEQGKWEIKTKMPDYCHRMWHSLVITWNGNIVPCCFDKDAGHVMGNISAISFRQIWERPDYRAFRNKLFSGRKDIDICKNCSEGLQN
jgi:radical SAM protein with 4Fe4S-binding SPASM domain